MPYANALKWMVIDIKDNDDSTYNSTPANHRKQNNVALGLDHFPKLPQKKKIESITPTFTDTTNSSTTKNTISMISEDKLHTLNTKLATIHTGADSQNKL
eukprot:15361613-Ditylum_brightwellii.AAC.1